ncbi:RES family NAD+ phosphorylase [Pedobacter sp. MW01-1-1]|uniref:RES family NAD+ phosphorylase n=1 Tax=Pedobacter sp. MW01-1-1 TaxID=3383027 RepID=UPI003FF05D06
MIVYRLAAMQYINDKDGIGAKLFGGRWNEVNTPCIYTSEHISLALLEKFVHAKATNSLENIGLLKITVPDNPEIVLSVDKDKLDDNWSSDIHYTQWIGEQLLNDSTILAFHAPSVIIPQERNIVLNPRSKFFNQLIFSEIIDFKADFRLLNKLLSGN